jgi:hypothetical protein
LIDKLSEKLIISYREREKKKQIAEKQTFRGINLFVICGK